MLREGVWNDSSSSRADAFLLRLGVAGTEGGGVGSIDSDGMILYNPSFDRKSWDLLASKVPLHMFKSFIPEYHN